MITQVLNRQFVLDQLEQVKTHLQKLAKAEGETGRRRAAELPEGAEDLTSDDYENALEFVNKSIQQETRQSSGQLGFEQPEDERRRGKGSALMDDFSFFSRDPVISNLQSALEEYFETQQPDMLEKVFPKTQQRRRDGSSLPPAAQSSIKGCEPRRGDQGRRLFNQFSITDPRWVCSAVSMGIRWFRGKHKFVENPAAPKPILDQARIIMVGDWGSGIPRAQKVAAEIRKVIDEGKARGLQQHVIHLGDIYYSGWKPEVKKHFLKYWPVKIEEADEITSWAVNGNHEMYSGGHAYFDTLLEDPRFKGHKNHDGENSSIFSLVNSKWRMLGIDSAWEEHDLVSPQPQWIRSQIREAEQAGQKVILLSHHQLFSAFEPGGEKMVAALGDLLESPKIHSWFWGHEHRCAAYKNYMNIRFARLVGHSGVPVYQWKKQSDPVSEPAIFEYRGRFKEGLEQWALFGFAVLDFNGPNIDVRYINEDGDQHHSEKITTA
jgi:hypothetical protein